MLHCSSVLRHNPVLQLRFLATAWALYPLFGAAQVPAPPPTAPTHPPLPSAGGKLDDWWMHHQKEMGSDTAGLTEALCIGGSAGGGSWRGQCSETVRSASLSCAEKCRERQDAAELFDEDAAGFGPDDPCEEGNARVCYSVCLDEKLFDDRDLVLRNYSDAVTKEREQFWKDIVLDGRQPGKEFWTDSWEWEEEKAARVKLTDQFRGFWGIVCQNSTAASCLKASECFKDKAYDGTHLRSDAGVANATQCQYTCAVHSRCRYFNYDVASKQCELKSSRPEPEEIKDAAGKISGDTGCTVPGLLQDAVNHNGGADRRSREVFQAWLSRTQLPVAFSLVARCQPRGRRRGSRVAATALGVRQLRLRRAPTART